MISCDVSTLVSPAPAITPLPPEAIGTIVVETAQAAATQTEALIPPSLTPTLTPLPTRTPTITPSPTATFIFILSTPTRAGITTNNTATPGQASTDYACTLVNQTPPDGTTMKRNQNFSVIWTVQNTGSASWDSNNVDFAFASGAKMSPLKAVDLPKTVAPGGSIDLKLSMVAPGSPDMYRTAWTLEQSKQSFCHVDLTIVVK